MTLVNIPITNQPNQSLAIKVPVGDLNLNLQLLVYWNSIAEYWQMNVTSIDTGEVLINGFPLVGGDYPAGNILRQFGYMGIGEAYLVPLNANTGNVYPGLTDWGTNFILLWGEYEQ